jgi:hypothetical protein
MVALDYKLPYFSKLLQRQFTKHFSITNQIY